jgi:predicted RNA binding protein YcfA (HicA-like mRNA interferase family)
VKLPRNVNGPQLVKALGILGYQVTRQKGSHIRVTTQRDGENHEVIPSPAPSKQARSPAFSGTSLPTTG